MIAAGVSLAAGAGAWRTLRRVHAQIEPRRERMAEIRVEPQRRGRGWVWILVIVLILVIAAIWYFSSRRGTTGSSPATTTSGSATAPSTSL
jgi:hypothetical protein